MRKPFDLKIGIAYANHTRWMSDEKPDDGFRFALTLPDGTPPAPDSQPIPPQYSHEIQGVLEGGVEDYRLENAMRAFRPLSISPNNPVFYREIENGTVFYGTTPIVFQKRLMDGTLMDVPDEEFGYHRMDYFYVKGDFNIIQKFFTCDSNGSVTVPYCRIESTYRGISYYFHIRREIFNEWERADTLANDLLHCVLTEPLKGKDN